MHKKYVQYQCKNAEIPNSPQQFFMVVSLLVILIKLPILAWCYSLYSLPAVAPLWSDTVCVAFSPSSKVSLSLADIFCSPNEDFLPSCNVSCGLKRKVSLLNEASKTN